MNIIYSVGVGVGCVGGGELQEIPLKTYKIILALNLINADNALL